MCGVCLHVLGCQSVFNSSKMRGHLATHESVLRSSLRTYLANVMRNSNWGQALSQVLGLWHPDLSWWSCWIVCLDSRVIKAVTCYSGLQ